MVVILALAVAAALLFLDVPSLAAAVLVLAAAFELWRHHKRASIAEAKLTITEAVAREDQAEAQARSDLLEQARKRRSQQTPSGRFVAADRGETADAAEAARAISKMIADDKKDQA